MLIRTSQNPHSGRSPYRLPHEALRVLAEGERLLGGWGREAAAIGGWCDLGGADDAQPRGAVRGPDYRRNQRCSPGSCAALVSTG